MNVKKALFFGLVAVTGAVVTGEFITARTNDYPEYQFTGKIGSEQVEFLESPWNSRRAILTVKKSDGRILMYSAREGPGHALTLEDVMISAAGGQRTVLSGKTQNPFMEEVMGRARADFGEYLSGIIKAKASQYHK